MTQQLDVNVRHDHDHVIIDVAGEVDIETAPRLREVVTQVTDDGAERLVFDLSNVTFVDSVGLGVFVLARKKMLLRQGTIGIVAPTRRVVAIFKIAGLDELFRVRPSLTALLAEDNPAEPA
ncbi:STAS domain-containing protein [Aeromicrobium wangtongii]|uniref:Anti-sigma factor antagonist n=1 Tax=Aeromicrobium wangtongii TaxID=2969247 RepID=A0ABY5M9Y2_9ACTN|nr:STAS domain-containing protein [Aeromicrobium wangtongii]MCD9197451.1 STAS domain-containing protein [Aeromicrobium wangtongii]MCL3818380.1 STAS domain-containing protein [Aeromicrobium wangtongii]UUP14944.1 STAS domain-containing protein [Aeromicrobium wangtongii]